ncbi:hypothetical protein TI04_05545 [Achromatium sp. WMS2]|nr:hypothetical protein TI04_05545 [Achromatium sp. WMS2]
MLENIPLFRNLSADDIAILERNARKIIYQKNRTIITEGEDGDCLYILLQGQVRVYVKSSENKELVLGIHDTPGNWFGELALLGNIKRTASVDTMADSTFLVMDSSSFVNCVQERPHIAFTVIQHLVFQVKNLTERVSILAFNDVYERLVGVLHEMAREEQGQLVINGLTQTELARRIGASREMVSRVMKGMRNGGYIKVETKRITIVKKLPAHY